MDEWEYLSISIQLRDVGRGRQVWTLVDEPNVQGMHAILNHYGSLGFELVNIAPEQWEPVSGERQGVVQYHAFFKRHKQV